MVASQKTFACPRIDFNGFGSMDNADDLPSPGTIFPVRGQPEYSEGPRAYYCLWSILYRSSLASKLHRLSIDMYVGWYP
jgi:hypothetical protein